MITGAGSLQKLLHLAQAREAFSAGDLSQALSEVDAAVAADATFGAAQSLRREIVARMDAKSRAVTLPPTVPRVREAVVVLAAPPKTHRRPSSPWPARTRAAVGIGTLFAAGVMAVMLVRSGGTASRHQTSSNAVPQVSRAAVPVPKLPVAPSASGADVPLPAVARPAPPPRPQVPAPVSQVETTEWMSSRLARLNVRPRWRAAAVHVEDAALLRDLGQGISELWVGKLTGNEDVIFVGGSLDANDWAKLRASIKPTGVVWRIYSHRSTSPDATVTTAAAGFTRGKQIRYSSDYIAEQFTPHRR